MIPSPDYIIGILIDANFSLDNLQQPNPVTHTHQSIKSLGEVAQELTEQTNLLKHQVGKGEAPDLQEREKQRILSAIEAIKQHEKTEVSRTTEVAVRQFWTSLKKFEKEVSRNKSANKVKSVKKKVTKAEKVDTSGR